MSIVRPALVVAGVLCFVGLPQIAAAADWPHWGGSDGRNMISQERNLPASFVPGSKKSGGGIDLSTTKNVKWAVQLGSYAYGNPTVAGGKVFVGTDDALLRNSKRFKRTRAGLVQCLDEATGKLLWRLPTTRRTKGLPKDTHFSHQHLGVCSSPACRSRTGPRSCAPRSS